MPVSFPPIRVGGFEMWVHARQFPAAQDGWDGNWLIVTAHCTAPGASVWVRGPFMDTLAIYEFCKGLKELHDKLTGVALLQSLEPQLAIKIGSSDRLGHFRTEVHITPDPLTQTHRFEFEIDQSYLPPVIKQCTAVLDEFPVRDAASRGVLKAGV